MVWWNTLRLKSNSPEVRSKALERLDPARDARSLELLLAGLGDEDAQVRCAAVKGLEPVKDDQSLIALTTALQDPNSKVREVASSACDVRTMCPTKVRPWSSCTSTCAGRPTLIDVA